MATFPGGNRRAFHLAFVIALTVPAGEAQLPSGATPGGVGHCANNAGQPSARAIDVSRE